MKTFNRIVSVLLILLLVAVLIVSAVVPFTVLKNLLYTLQQAQDVLGARWPWNYLIFLTVDIVLVLLALVLLWLEVRPEAKKTLVVRTAGGTQAEVTTASVQQALQQRVGQLADVSKVRPVVTGRGGGVDVLLELETPPDIDIPAKVDEVSQAARDQVESKMGLRISRIKVLLKHGSYGRARPPASVAGAPGVTADSVVPETPAPEAQSGQTGPEGTL